MNGDLRPAFTEIPAPLMTTTFYFFSKSDFKAETVLISSSLNGCLIWIPWKTFEAAGRRGFFAFPT